MEPMTLPALEQFVLESYRAQNRDDHFTNGFHCRHALANAKQPVRPKDWVVRRYETEPVLTVGPLQIASAIDYLKDTKKKRKQVLDEIANGKSIQKYDAADLTQIKSEGRFPTIEATWASLREAGFEVADLGVKMEAVRHFYARTPGLQEWIARVAAANLEAFHAERRAKEAVAAS